MWRRQNDGKIREVSEMYPDLENVNGHERANNSSTIDQKTGNEQDRRDMARLGKSQELGRLFKGIHLFVFAVILGNTAPWALMSIDFSLTNGGTAGSIIMFAIVAFCMFFVVLSMAELASMAPTTGGQYHWVSEFAPRRYQKFMSFSVGWYTVLGWQTSLVGTALASAQLFQAVVILYNPSFASKGWVGTLVTIVLTCVAMFVNVFGYKKLPILEGIAVVVYFLVFIALITIFLVMGDRGGAEILTTFSSNGWPTVPLSCLVGILGPVQTLMGSDAQAHLAEETMDAARVVPRAMVATALANYIIGLITVVVAMYVLGPDVQAIRDTPTGVPVVEILLRTTGNTLATAVLTCLLGLLFVFCLTNALTTGSRQLWSFARDKGIPFHEYFAKVSPTRATPVRATMATLVVTIALSVFNIFSAVALSTLISLSLTGLLSSYELTIASILSYRIRGERPRQSPFNLGPRFGFVCNAIAFIFLAVVLLMMFFPTSPNPRPGDMNWSVVMYGFVTIVSLVFYFTVAKHSYIGPVMDVRQQHTAEANPATPIGTLHMRSSQKPLPRDELSGF